jgi:hypothetical protein
MDDQAAWAEFLAQAPASMFLLVLLAHGGGAFVAGWATAKMARVATLAFALAAGALFLAAGIANLMMIPHPLWFSILDLVLYLPAAWLGGVLGDRRKEAPLSPA